MVSLLAPNPRSPSKAAGWALSVAAVVAAVLLRWLLDRVLGDTLPLVTLFGAVAAAVWFCGSGAATVCALVGYVACAYLFIEPRGELGLAEPANLLGLVAYLFTCALIIVLGETMRRAQARASQRRELLRVTLRSIGDAVITTDMHGDVTYLNEVAEELTGWSHANAIGQPLDTVFRIVNEDTRRPVESPAARALREGVVVGLANHTVLIRRDGSERPIDDSAAPIRDEQGNVSGCVLIFRDVTAQRQVERDKASQLVTARTLAAIVESSELAIVGKTLDGTIRSWNAAAERLFGHPAERAIGRHISLVIPPDRLEEENRIVASLKGGQRVEHLETERLRADGKRVTVSLSISPIKDEDGNVVGASKIARDVSRERQVEADRQKFVTLVETSTDFIAMFDLGGMPFFMNRAGLAKAGLDSVEQARETPVREFFFPEDQARMMDEFFPSVLRDGHGEIEIRFRHFKTGDACWMAFKVLTLLDPGGKPIAFATVSQDITERKRLEDNLRALAADLSNADRRKDEFLATLAHELRGPLAPLANVLEIWKQSGDADALDRARGTMERQLGQLVRLVDDLLDLNRITHDRFELRRGRVNLADVIRQAVETCEPFAQELGHELRVALPAEPVWVNADRARLAQVFGNLLNNACKYTEPGGRISIAAEQLPHEAVVTVADTGTGIPRDKLEKIFDMFMQVDRSTSNVQGGMGIGLTIVKRLVQMHGGAVEARSAGARQGAEFVVRLPLLSVEASAEAPRDTPAAEPRARAAQRILVVDDNVDAAASLAMLLQMSGHETLTAHDGAEAIAAVAEHRPEVVLLDIGLPKVNGYDVCRHIRAQEWGADIVVLALTGWGQEDDRRKSGEAGFDGHLVKPVDFNRLTVLLDELLTAERA